MFSKSLLAVSVASLLSYSSFAQLPCGTDPHHQHLLQQHPGLAAFEKKLAESPLGRSAMRTTSVADTTSYDIPIVVHVVHDYGLENISDNIIYQAVENWSKVYTLQNPDTIDVIAPFKPYIGNPRMRLHLATIDPQGRPTKGVVRHASYLSYVADDQAKYQSWPNNKYINIWLIGAFGSSGAAAYAYYPSTGAYIPFYDGIISLYTYTDYAKTIPHELGHVLNLAHVWGSTNNPEVACGDDGVDDTPPTKGHSPAGCTAAALYDTVCARGYIKRYSAFGGGDSLVNYPDTVNAQNIMDYTYCERMFSKGQSFRMQAALTSATAGRNNLITPANLAATGALAPMPDLLPIPDYVMNRATGAGVVTDKRSHFLTYNNAASFSFKNASWNDTITGVTWIFSNGATTPVSTSMTTVTNKFTEPGWVTLKLVATSNAGSDTLVNTKAVYAADPTPVGGLGYYQDFNDASTLGNWPMVNYYNNQFRWEQFATTGHGGGSCIRFRSYDTSARIYGNATGDYDDLFTPAFNISGITGNLYLNFYSAGARTTRGLSGSEIVNDSMVIEVSNSGGLRWNRLASIKSTDLAHNGVLGSEFIPTAASQWKPRAISIPEAYRGTNTFFRFRYHAGSAGNNFYIDGIHLFQFPAGVNDPNNATAGTVEVYPNPATDGSNILFRTGITGTATVTVTDITGRVLHNTTHTYAPGDWATEAIPRSTTPVAGMYFITVNVDGNATTKKLTVY